MKAVLVVALLVVAASAASLTDEQSEWLFSNWMQQHNKVYAADQVVHRFNIWKENMEMILNHNLNSKASWTLGMNAFGDLTAEEWKARMGIRRVAHPVKPTHKKKHSFKPTKEGAAPPATWDWRDHNAINPVQNQGQCGSCWAFTAGDAVSGAWAIKTGLLFAVSVQEIVDCSGPQGNQGCNGGLMDQAFQWVIANGGICDWQEYQYTAETGNCMSGNCTNVAAIKAYVDVPTLDENALMTATYSTVVSTAVEADQSVFQFYTGGIIDSAACGDELDHGMTVVGWGTDKGVDYWTLRNMWGEAWGEAGYVRLVRGKNMCGLATEPSYVTN